MIPNSQEIAADWSLRVEAALGRYDGELLDGVATRLLKPRGTLPREEVLDRTIEFFSNPVQVDRRISALDPAAQILLEVAAKSQKTVWFVGNLVEIVLGLGWKDGIGAVVGLLESGLAYPVFQLPTTPSPANEFQEMTTAAPLSQPVQFGNFLHWLSSPGPMGHNLFFVPGVLERMEGKPPLLPDLSKNPHARAPGRDEEDGQQADESEPFEEVIYGAPPFPGVEADCCEWFIRISLLWQKTQKNPLKMTQAGEFFKKDQERLEDSQLVAPIPESNVVVPDLGYWLAESARATGVLQAVDIELQATDFPVSWGKGWTGALRELLHGSFGASGWNPQDGWKPQVPGEPVSNPFPSALAIAFSLLGSIESGSWISPRVIEAWILRNHPWWAGQGVRPSRRKPFLETWLAGIVWPMGLVEMAKDPDGKLLFRLSASGKMLMSGASLSGETRAIPKMLLIQPNLEIMAFRQGLDPARIAKLSMFAVWKAFGPACMLQLTPDSVYRALELGESFESVRAFLDGHSTRPVPQAIIDQIGSWASKRERVVIHTSAMVLEFSSATDLEAALGRGLMAVRLGDRHALVDNEDAVDFRMFRLSGSRDYRVSPEPCIRQGPDGLDLTVDETKSDLLLETELPLLADPVLQKIGGAANRHRITPASMARVRERGWNLEMLEQWFRTRTGESPKSSVKLFFLAKARKSLVIEPRIILQSDEEETTEGLWQWQEFKAVTLERVGPCAISIHPEKVEQAKSMLESVGLKWGGMISQKDP